MIKAEEVQTNRRDCIENPGSGPAIGARGIKRVVLRSEFNLATKGTKITKNTPLWPLAAFCGYSLLRLQRIESTIPLVESLVRSEM